MSIEQLTDLEELMLRCRSRGAKEHIREAVLAYKAGALRVSIVATWTAVVFDLIDKVRELAISGSADAQNWLNEYENHQMQFDKGNKAAIKQLLAFENDIIIAARDKFLLISHNEFIDLERLKDDRNRCAHPTFQRIETPYYPTAEQARYHIKNSIVHVLSQPPIQGKFALNNLKKLVESNYFPADDSSALSQLANSDLAIASDSLVRAFIDYLLFGLLDKTHGLYRQYRAIAALNSCIQLHANISWERISKQFNKCIMQIEDDTLILTVVLIGYVSGLWSNISEQAQNKIKIFLLNCSDDEFTSVVPIVLNIDGLTEVVSSRIAQSDCNSLVKIKQFHEITPCVERAVYLFSHASNWNEANHLYSTLICRVTSALTDNQIETIILSPSRNGADLPHSVGFYNFLEQIINEGRMTRDVIRDYLRTQGLDHYASTLSFLK